jgi:hypothetical protein
MNIPLDRLYHYIENIAQEIYGDCVIIYRFWPHGSKNIQDLNLLRYLNLWQDQVLFPAIWCNDQEPLEHEFYKVNLRDHYDGKWISILKSIDMLHEIKNLNFASPSHWEKGLLLHSEKRSNNLEKYQKDNKLIPVYYWSHAIIARDWFRYAEHIKQQKNISKTFLIYNRAWSGTREYRLRFLDLLLQLGLEHECQTSVNPVEPELGIHYKMHKFNNSVWQPTQVLEKFFPQNTAPSYYSANFDIEDYESTDIEIVLETLFDDQRLHLTEKALRPIACGQPFILAGTHGSLEYLRSYGFKTFSDVWEESYDLEKNPEVRLVWIAELMQRIAGWTPDVRERKMAKAQAIADYNRQHFFSKEFFNLVTEELKTNLKLAFVELNHCNNYHAWINRWQQLITYPEVIKFLKDNKDSQDPTMPTDESVEFLLNLAQNQLIKVANKNKT